jgi:hypothetical protein
VAAVAAAAVVEVVAAGEQHSGTEAAEMGLASTAALVRPYCLGTVSFAVLAGEGWEGVG